MAISLCHDRISRIRDFGVGGALLEGLSPVPVGEKLECKLWLSSYETLRLNSIVRRQDGENSFGVEFIGIKPDEEERLLRYCGAPTPAR